MTMKRIYARDCEAVTLDPDVATPFVATYHRQGAVSVRCRSVGLLYQGELVGVMQFCMPRTKAKRSTYSTEMVRMCFIEGTQVIGGASKMMSFFIRTHGPHDIFTYQDTTGEVSDVYERCGMRLVSQSSRKQYIVKNGETLATAKRGEAYSMSTVVRIGPDALLGTSLGEQHRDDGSRMTNPELFEQIGWHVEETTGDRVYEWLNPDRSFYVYRISSLNSPKWYAGVHHLKFSGASVEQAALDGYWGSGGIKFRKWCEEHNGNIRKEIVGIVPTYGEACELEAQVIGDSWRDDPDCLNSRPGGYAAHSYKMLPSVKQWCQMCESLTTYFGQSCLVCSARASYSTAWCDSCMDKTAHKGSRCMKCVCTQRYCDECSRVTTFRGQTCASCSSRRYIEIRHCDACDRDTYHSSGLCARCKTLGSISERWCDSCDAVTVHQGSSCATCSANGAMSTQYCEACDMETTHQGKRCCRCHSLSSIALKYCPECQRETKHKGNSCRTCSATVIVKWCPSCQADTKHRGDTCSTCMARATLSEQYCETCKAVTKHKGNSCFKCASRDKDHLTYCGDCERETTHRGTTCMSCATRSKVQVRWCPSCQADTKHSGWSSCYGCRGRKSSHKKLHTNKGVVSDQCEFCSIAESGEPTTDRLATNINATFKERP